MFYSWHWQTNKWSRSWRSPAGLADPCRPLSITVFPSCCWDAELTQKSVYLLLFGVLLLFIVNLLLAVQQTVSTTISLENPFSDVSLNNENVFCFCVFVMALGEYLCFTAAGSEHGIAAVTGGEQSCHLSDQQQSWSATHTGLLHKQRWSTAVHFIHPPLVHTFSFIEQLNTYLSLSFRFMEELEAKSPIC